MSVIVPTAEVGFWAWLPVTLSPSRAAEPTEIASDNRSSGSLPSLTPVMRPETVGQDVCNIPIVPFFFSFSALALKDCSSQQDFPFSRISFYIIAIHVFHSFFKSFFQKFNPVKNAEDKVHRDE